MSVARAEDWWNENDYHIPDSFVTLDGLTICTREYVWRVSLNHTVNWQLASGLPQQLLYPMRAFICHVLRKNTGSSAYVTFGRLVRGVEKIEPEELAKEVGVGVGIGLFYLLKASLDNESDLGPGNKLDILSVFRRWYLWCVDCEFPGFDETSAIELAAKVIGGGPKGQAVLSSDPDQGPLTFIQDTQLEAAISSASDDMEAASAETLQVLLAVMLSKAYGLYGGHLQLLNENDYSKDALSDGSKVFWINLPRLKKRGRRKSVGVRKRRLPARIAGKIELLIKRNGLNVERGADMGRVTSDRPLFVREKAREYLSGTELHGDAYRWSKEDFHSAMSKFSAENNLGFKITPRRLRYSFATRLVEEGCSPLELADALDHTDLQHVMVYFNARGRVVRQLDEGMALRLAPFAKAFVGKLVPGRAGATRVNDPASVIRFKVLSGEDPDVGSCGSIRYCGMNSPLACYTCRKFEPWIDAPHNEVLSAMLCERQRRVDAGLDERLIQIHDAAILAAADVVRRTDSSADCGAEAPE